MVSERDKVIINIIKFIIWLTTFCYNMFSQNIRGVLWNWKKKRCIFPECCINQDLYLTLLKDYKILSQFYLFAAKVIEIINSIPCKKCFFFPANMWPFSSSNWKGFSSMFRSTYFTADIIDDVVSSSRRRSHLYLLH
jgi:hypothetical protein